MVATAFRGRGTKHERLLTDEDRFHNNITDDEVKSKAEPKQKKAKPLQSALPRSAAQKADGEGGGGGEAAPMSDAKVQHEKVKANVDSIIKLRTELEMEYVKALYTAFDMEKKLEKIASTSSAAP